MLIRWSNIIRWCWSKVKIKITHHVGLRNEKNGLNIFLVPNSTTKVMKTN